MRHVGRNSALVVALLILLSLAIYPPQENLRKGKDLAGGVSLVYTVDVDDDDPPGAIDQTIEVLKKRVNPRGLFEISFVKQGNDRIEITMPLPSEAVKARRAEFDTALESFEPYVLDTDGLERALRLRGEERRAALEALARSDSLRLALSSVAAAAEVADTSRAAFEQALQANAGAAEGEAPPIDQQTVGQLQSDAAQAEIDLEGEKDRLLSMVVRPEEIRAALELSDEGLRIIDDEAEGGFLELPSPRDRALENIRNRAVGIEGATEALEAIIASWDSYSEIRRGLDDPSDLIRLLRGAGVLNFRIGVDPSRDAVNIAQLRQELSERGPGGITTPGMGWYSISSLEDWYGDVNDFRLMMADPPGFFLALGHIVGERDGVYYMLLKDEPGMRLTQAEGTWALDAAFPTVDEIGRPAIGFRMDGPGGTLMGSLTGGNLQRKMAVLLDGAVYTAPNINGRITTNGIIQGRFTQQEIAYIVNTLAAGSLSAKLGEQPISQSSLAPSMGQDNLDRGLRASAVALVAVAAFMMLYYMTNGVVAIVALTCNAIIILGIMSLARASFTLPGIAGIILTFGTAVDANVLIYERIREELLGGSDLRTAVRTAFRKVSSTIVDANVTNLIVCFVLGFYGTQEIKGFGITLGIGVIGTMFCSLVITRLIYTILVEVFRFEFVRHQLPIAVPVIDRVLTPKINWMAFRPIFVVISLVLVASSVGVIAMRGEKMLDTVFIGGTELDMQFRAETESDGTMTPVTMTRAEVQDVVRGLTDGAETEGDTVRLALRDAEVVAVNAQNDGVTSDRFKIRAPIGPEDEDRFHDLLVAEFGPDGVDKLDAQPALSFEGSAIETLNTGGGAPVYPIIAPELGENINRPEVANDAARFLGGVAIVLEFDDPHRPRKEILDARLDIMRNDPSFSATTLRRPHELVVIDGSDEAVETAILLTSDPSIEYFNDQDAWRVQLAQDEWNMVRAALTESSSLASVSSFSAAVAESFRFNALFAVVLSFTLILIYVWVRFGSVRYSVAAIIPLLHDVIIAVGLIGVAEILYEASPSVAAIGIRPFKIDMGLVAAILAIIGYSLNDTIVILDRIRENRGKLVNASKEVINKSINQTFSRTIITTGTTLLSLLVLFLMGGEGVASFSYALICGMIIGTYSSIGVAAPIVFNSSVPPAGRTSHTPDAVPGQNGAEGDLLPAGPA